VVYSWLFVVHSWLFVVIRGYSWLFVVILNSFRFNVSMKLFDIVERVDKVDEV